MAWGYLRVERSMSARANLRVKTYVRNRTVVGANILVISHTAFPYGVFVSGAFINLLRDTRSPYSNYNQLWRGPEILRVQPPGDDPVTWREGRGVHEVTVFLWCPGCKYHTAVKNLPGNTGPLKIFPQL